MKKILGLMLVIFSFVFLTNVKSYSKLKNKQSLNAVSRIVEVGSLEEAKKYAGFNISLPHNMFDDSYEKVYRVEPKKLIEVRYIGSEEQIVIRKSKKTEMEDISGDYNIYPQVETKEFEKNKITSHTDTNLKGKKIRSIINSISNKITSIFKGKDEKIKVVSKGSDDRINVIYWNTKDYSYSISINPGKTGYSKEKVKEIFLNVN